MHPEHPNDTSKNVVSGDNVELMFTDEQLGIMTQFFSGETIDLVPGFRYWAMSPDQRYYDQGKNIMGHQQRAWEFYWSIRAALQEGKGVCVGIGTGGVGSPAEFTTDRFNQGETPDIERYGDPAKGGGNGNSCLALDANSFPWALKPTKLAAVIFNHSFEHLENQFDVIIESMRVLQPGGYFCQIMPDMTYSQRGKIDSTHTIEWSADQFLKLVEDDNRWKVQEHNTLDNKFSFNTVLKKN